jgi:hypothetical protein
MPATCLYLIVSGSLSPCCGAVRVSRGDRSKRVMRRTLTASTAPTRDNRGRGQPLAPTLARAAAAGVGDADEEEEGDGGSGPRLSGSMTKPAKGYGKHSGVKQHDKAPVLGRLALP